MTKCRHSHHFACPVMSHACPGLHRRHFQLPPLTSLAVTVDERSPLPSSPLPLSLSPSQPLSLIIAVITDERSPSPSSLLLIAVAHTASRHRRREKPTAAAVIAAVIAIAAASSCCSTAPKSAPSPSLITVTAAEAAVSTVAFQVTAALAAVAVAATSTTAFIAIYITPPLPSPTRKAHRPRRSFSPSSHCRRRCSHFRTPFPSSHHHLHLAGFITAGDFFFFVSFFFAVCLRLVCLDLRRGESRGAYDY